MILETLELILFWVGIAAASHVLHLLAGVLSVGRSEVRRQVSGAFDQLGYRGYAVFVLTVGFWPPGEFVDERGGQ